MIKSSLQKMLKANELDAAIVSSTSNISYLINYNGFSPLEREAFLIITRKNLHLITDGRYINAVKSLNVNINLHEITPKHPFTSILEEIINSEKIKTLGFESENITVAEYVKIKKIKAKLKPITLSNLRVIKTPDEIKKIKKSCNIAITAFTATQKQIKLGMSEKDIATIFELEVKKSGAELSFPTIVAINENAATPHHMTSNKKLNISDLILFDCGVKYDNYCSDMTRTFFFGQPASKFQKIYSVAEESQKKSIEYINSMLQNHEPILASTVDKIARDFIVKEGFRSIPHSLGHGIGIEVHEAPRLGPTSKDTLNEGMVFSIEPGIYIPNLGGVRIEDLFTIQNNQLIKLT